MLMACPDCQGSVSSRANRCPDCGCPVYYEPPEPATRSDSGGFGLMILLGIIGFALWMAFMSNPRAVWDFLGWFPRR